MEIECEFGDIDWDFVTDATETVYACKVTSCNITKRGSAIASFKGDHEDGKNNKSVTALWFKNNKVHYIPRNLTKIFPNLVYLAINKCELKEVSAEDLVGLEDLENLDLWGNKITTLPEDLFKNMKNLKEVGLSANLIQKFNAKILEPIKDTIEYFGILGNPGIDEYFNKKTGIRDFIERLKLLESKKKDFQRFNNLLTSDKHSDLTIKVRDKEYRVHKKILSLQSFVFDKMFSDDAEAATKNIDNIGNFSEGAIEEFLRFFYIRTAPSKENINELMELAVEFDVPELKLKCESVLVQKIKPESALQLYNLAVQKSLQVLKRKSFEIIQECHPDVGDFLYDDPDLVNRFVKARDEIQAKKIKLEKEE